MNLRHRALSVLSLVVLLCATMGLRAQAYTTIVVFGDSLSDTGNFARVSTNAYGSGFRIPGPIGGYTDGRFTDGGDTAPMAQMYTGVWVEQMAATLAAHPLVKASLDGGMDYAYGSAINGAGTQVVTYGPGNIFTVTVQNVGAQIATYLATNPVITNKTLFVVWGGANDVLRSSSPFSAPTAAVQEQTNVQTLITAGATDFLIPNLPPLGAIPRLNGSASTALMATALSAAYNSTLVTGLGTLAAANPGKTLHLYQVDIFSLFNSVLVSPAVFGFTNVTQMSQYQPVNPDTYLFWDDLHPTTYGHYLISRLAENVMTESTAGTTTLTVEAAMATPGQTISLKAVVTPPAGTTTVPTGLVTFYNGSTALSTVLLDASGTGISSFVAGAVSATPSAITAHYSGDAVYFAQVSAAGNVTVVATPVATTTTLASSNANVNLGSAVTFTATVSSALGVPTGTVTFLDGTVMLGTSTLTAGATSSTASYTTSALAAGSHSITAAFGAGATYAASTSAVVTEVVTAPAYTFTASPSTLTIASGSSGSTTLTITPVGGLTGTFGFACGTLPAHFSCSFVTSNVIVPGTRAAQSTQLTISTNAAMAGLRMPIRPGDRSDLPVFALLGTLPSIGALALLGRRRRQLRSLHLTMLLVVLSAGAALGLSGCAKSSSNAPAGTYQVPVMATPAGSGSAASLNITVVVQ